MTFLYWTHCTPYQELYTCLSCEVLWHISSLHLYTVPHWILYTVHICTSPMYVYTTFISDSYKWHFTNILLSIVYSLSVYFASFVWFILTFKLSCMRHVFKTYNAFKLSLNMHIEINRNVTILGIHKNMLRYSVWS